MSNADVFIKSKPCTPTTVDGITFALDATTGLWKGNGLDTTVNRMAGYGMPFLTGAEVTRFKYDYDNATIKAASLLAAQNTADAAAIALTADSANGTKITAMQAASAAVASASDSLSAAISSLQTSVNGKANPWIASLTPTTNQILVYPTIQPVKGKISVRFSPGSILRYASKFDSGNDLIVDMGPFNVNQIFGFTRIATAPNTLETPSSDFDRTATVLQTLSTDMVGPWQVMANANGDAGGEMWTGGGHNSTGAASFSGTPTARMLSLSVWLDGSPLTADGIVKTGSRLDITTVNRIQGYNTKTTTREILEETIQFTITDDGVEVHNEFTALEALTITRYYGLQCANTGLTTIHWPQGTPDTRQAISGNMNPGNKDTAPSVSRFCLGGSGWNLIGWIDRAYGIGTCSGLFHTLNVSFIDGTAQKTYFYMIRDVGLVITAGASSRWRGGYYFGPNLGTPGADQTCTFLNAGKRQYVVDFVSAGSAYLPVLPTEVNKAVTVVSSYGSITVGSITTPKGIPVSAPGASAAIVSLG